MNDLTISIDTKGEKPLYEQIYDYLKREMLAGKLRPGERLPSTRALCKYLQVSRSTVELAYEQLVSEGYIESIPYKGYYVAELDGICQIKTIQTKRLIEKKQTIQEIPFDYALNGIARNGFPYNTWRKLSRQVLDMDDGSLFQLGDPKGEYKFRETLANYLHHARGVECEPEQIVVGAGNDYLLMLLSTLISKEKKIAMENPTYLSAYRAFVSLGYQVEGVALDESGICVEQLEDTKADIAYVMPSHHFPMGTVMSVKRRLHLLKWADKKQGRYIIEDDYDSEFRYKGKPIPALQGMDANDKVIYLGTFSKSVAPAIRISYMVLPKGLLAQSEEQIDTFSVTVSKVDQYIMEKFIREGYFERHLNRMRGIYKTKHDCIINELHQVSDRITICGENAGVHIQISFEKPNMEKIVVKILEENGIKVYGLSDYYIAASDDYKQSSILIGYATLEINQIIQSMQKMKEIFRKI